MRLRGITSADLYSFRMTVVATIVKDSPALEFLTTSDATGCSTMNSNGYSTRILAAGAVTAGLGSASVATLIVGGVDPVASPGTRSRCAQGSPSRGIA